MGNRVDHCMKNSNIKIIEVDKPDLLFYVVSRQVLIFSCILILVDSKLQKSKIVQCIKN